MMLAIRSGATLAIVAVLALAGGRPATAGAPADGITYEEGNLSITTTADRTGILRVGLIHFSPAKPIDAEIIMGGHTFSTIYRVSSVSETELIGATTTTACAQTFCVTSDPEPFLLSGPVDTPPGPDDTLFFGTVASGGRITVAMSSGEVTAFILEGAPLACPLDIHAFDFFVFSEDPLVFVEQGVFNHVELSLVEVEQPEDQVLTGKLRFCGDFAWTAELVSPPAATPAPATTTPPPTSAGVAPTSAPVTNGMPAPTSTVLASQLPAAGAPTDGASNALPVVFAIAGALLLGGGLFAARRRA